MTSTNPIPGSPPDEAFRKSNEEAKPRPSYAEILKKFHADKGLTDDGSVDESFMEKLMATRTPETKELEEKAAKRESLKRMRQQVVVDVSNYDYIDAHFKNWVYVVYGDTREFYNPETYERLSISGWLDLHEAYLSDWKRKEILPRVMQGLELIEGHKIPIYQGLTFEPGCGRLASDNKLNLWNPPIEPVECSPDDLEPLIAHWETHFPNPRDLQIYLDYMYWAITRPDVNIRSALCVIGGTQGTGKTLILEGILSNVLGHKLVSRPTQKEIDTDYDRYKEGKKVVYIAEINNKFKSGFYAAMKEMISETHVTVHIKNKTHYEIPNYIFLASTSNHAAPVKLEDADRRWCFLESHAPKMDREVKEKLLNIILCNPGWIMHFFKNVYKPSEWDPADDAPQTDKKDLIQEASVGAIDDAFEGFLERLRKTGRVIFTHQDFLDWISDPACKWHDDKSFAKRPHTRLECYRKFGVQELGRQRNRRGTSARLWGVPDYDFTGYNITEMMDKYEELQDKASKVVNLKDWRN